MKHYFLILLLCLTVSMKNVANLHSWNQWNVFIVENQSVSSISLLAFIFTIEMGIFLWVQRVSLDVICTGDYSSHRCQRPPPLFILGSTWTLGMQFVINKLVHSESKKVFSVHFYDRHVPTFPRQSPDSPELYKREGRKVSLHFTAHSIEEAIKEQWDS
jgi:hypothetical protein